MNTERRLNIIRLRLTVVFSLVMAAALLVLALLAIRTDERVRSSELSADLLSRAQAGAQSIRFDEAGRLVLDGFLEDEGLANGYPQLYVFQAATSDSPVERAYAPEDAYFPDENLDEYGTRVLLEETFWEEDIWNEEGLHLHARGVALGGIEGASLRGSVVALANADDWLSGTEDFRRQLLLICSGLVVAAAVAGYWLAGRSIRPTAVALEQQERLIADAAHELRTPVARILAAAEGGLNEDEEPRQALSRVARTATNAGEALDDLLALARMDAGRQSVQVEPLRLDLLVEEIVSRHEDVDVDAVRTVVDGDPGLLRRAIDNLIRNAVTHGQNGRGSGAEVTVYPNRVVVSDDGPGVPDDELATIFERFHSRAGSEGHGLGLPIVDWVARAHQGRVEVTNRPEGGASFALILEPSEADSRP